MRLTWVQPEDLLPHELKACTDEGKDVADLAERWRAAGGSLVPPVSGAAEQPAPEPLRELARTLLKACGERAAPERADEPDGLSAIEALLPACPALPGGPATGDRLLGAWLGRAAGCLLGKPVEKIPREGIREILTAAGRWPLDAYFTAAGLPADVSKRWPWNRRSRLTSLAENIDGMPEDDDLNFALIAVRVLERVGHEFRSADVAEEWLTCLPGGRVFTAERVAYRNLLQGIEPPATATACNPYREWIGAQIRTDVYGWVSPGQPLVAARMAWHDAAVSHVRNGIYGAMWAAGLAAAAVVADDVATVLDAAQAVIPPASRLAGAVTLGRRLGDQYASDPETGLDRLYAAYGELHWVHVLNNAALVAFSLTAGGGDFAKSIALAVTGGWDTDSDGATVGAVAGALCGAGALPGQWIDPLRNRLATSIPGMDGISFGELAGRIAQLSAGARS